MPTIFNHAVSALAFGHLYPSRRWTARFWLLAVACALLPDADVIAFSLGIPYDHVLGHRGLTHSLVFAVFIGWVIVELAFREVSRFSRTWWGVLFFFAVVTASHGVLDAFTDGGLGVAFFAPFDNTRYFSSWRPLRVSPIGAGFFSQRGLETILSEFTWAWLPSLFCIGLGQAFRLIHRRRKAKGTIL